MSEAVEPGIGEMLASARQAKGMTTVEIADKLKLTSRQIEALEAEEFDKLPAAVFVRGFIRNYARLVGLDAEQLLATLGATQGATETITAPSEGVTISASPLKRWVIYLAGGFSLFLLLVALLYQWLSEGEQAYVVDQATQAAAPSPQEAPTPSAPPAAIQPAPAPTPTLFPEPVVRSGASSTPAELPAPMSAPAATPVPAPARLPSPAQAPVVPAVPNAAAVTAPPNPYLSGTAAQAPEVDHASRSAKPPGALSTLRFTSSDESWVQVVDGAGKRGSQLITRGSAASFTGTPPFKIVVGNAASVKLQYNDHGIDLSPYIGDKVARLTLE